MNPPLLQPKSTEAYYTSTVLHREGCRHTEIPRADGPSLLLSLHVQSPTTPQQYDIGECRCTKYQWKPTPPQVYRALLHQDSITLQNADIPTANVLLNPPLWNQVLQRCTTVDSITLHNAYIPNTHLTTHANKAEEYRTLLHQENVTLENADVHSADLSHSPLTGMCLPIVLLHKVML